MSSKQGNGPVPDGWLTEGAIALSDYMALPASVRERMDAEAALIDSEPLSQEELDRLERKRALVRERLAMGDLPPLDNIRD